MTMNLPNIGIPLHRAHAFKVGDLVRHIDGGDTMRVEQLTVRVVEENEDLVAYPTYTLVSQPRPVTMMNRPEEVEDVLCTADLKRARSGRQS